MSETLEELKAIVDNAPDGAVSIFKNTYIDGNGRFYSDGAWFGVNGYIEIKQPTRSLSDIKRIIELMELLEDISALGFLEEINDSGKSHRDVCKKAKLILGDL